MRGAPASASKGFLWLFASSARVSFAPCSGIGHARGWPATTRWGPMGGARWLGQVTPAWHLPPQTHLHSLIPHGQDRSDLGMCLQGLQSAGRHPALTQELRPWEQAWRSGV